ncbi:hypothetical protein D3C73_917600 [compost metagenome]
MEVSRKKYTFSPLPKRSNESGTMFVHLCFIPFVPFHHQLKYAHNKGSIHIRKQLRIDQMPREKETLQRISRIRLAFQFIFDIGMNAL